MYNESQHVQKITACAMNYSMYNELQHVQWITTCAMNYSMYNELQHVQWITACTMNYSMCNELQHVPWITACTMNYGMCNEFAVLYLCVRGVDFYDLEFDFRTVFYFILFFSFNYFLIICKDIHV
jgi:virulence-associated protein VapD